MANLTVTDELLTAALAGYQAELDRIDSKMGEIRGLLGDRTNHTAAPSETGRPKRKFSAATRRKMAASQRARFAKLRQGSEAPPIETAKPKRKLSAAGRKAILAGVKKRWAAVRAAKQAQRPAVAKKAGRKKTVVNKVVARKPKKAATAPEQAASVGA